MKKLFSLLLLLFAFTACSDEETPLPPYQENLGDMLTNSSGRAVQMVFDNGSRRNISNTIAKLKPDTIIRVRALYTESGENVWLAQCAEVLTPHAKHYRPSAIHTDPVEIVAVWKGMDYINLKLNTKGDNTTTQFFGFHSNGITTGSDGNRLMKILLIHDRNKAPLYFTHETVLSLPLRPLDTTLRKGTDSISLTIHTENGPVEKRFAF